MIDIQNKVFNDVSTAVKTSYSSATCYAEYVATPASFPCMTLIEADNFIASNQIDSSGIENYVDVMYECNIFTNLKSGKKTQAYGIANVVDTKMQQLGFRRTMLSQIPNEDISIYRLLIRYEGRVSKGVTTTVGETTTTTHTIYIK